MDRDELQLIDASRAGDAEAFASLYHAHAGRVKVYFLRSGFAQGDADDMLQETFIRVHRSLGTFDGDRGGFGPWLAAIARNVTRKRWSRRQESDHLDPELAEETLPASHDPSASPEAREEIEALRLCVDSLPAELGKLVRLRYVESKTTRGMAEAAGMPEATIRLRLGEAKALLERCLKLKGILE